MATVRVTFRSAVSVGGSSVASKPRVSEEMTSSGTSAASTITALAGEVARIVVSGGPVSVVVGTSPTATAAGGDLVLDGMMIEIGALADGDKIAVIDT